MTAIYNADDLAERVCNVLQADISVFTPEIIGSFDFKGTAELLVKKSVPSWESILSGEDEDKKELLMSCVVFQTALLLAPNVKSEKIKIRQTTHAKVEYFDSGAFDKLIDSLHARLALLYEELCGFSGCLLPSVALSNEKHRFYGAGFGI